MKDIKDDLVELSISELMDCIEAVDLKDDFVEAIPKKVYSNIVRFSREESTVIQMRDFHNWVKLVMISNMADNYKSPDKRLSLLDISTGRGGDLSKWKKAHLTHVFAFDVSEQSIYSNDLDNQGAVERLKSLKKKNYPVNVQFEVGDATRPEGDPDLNVPEIYPRITEYLNKNKLGKFDFVSCQFALHYYFSSAVALSNVLALVSATLKPGGYFFGTTVDGNKVRKYFDFLPDASKVFKRKLFQIQRFFPKRIKTPFGNKYTFTIYDSLDKTNYFNTMGVSTEYLVDFDVLNKVAREHKLVPVNLNMFEKWSPTGDKKDTVFTNRADNHIPFQEIFEMNKWKPYNLEKQITPDELEISFLNSTFCFQKIK